MLAYPPHAVEAFELDVVDYLLKPFSYDRFLKAVNKVKEDAVAETGDEAPGQHLLLKEKGGLIKVAYNKIIYIKAAKDYVKIVTNEQQHIASFTMKGLEEQLPADKFIRIHKSYIVALEQVKMIKAGSVMIAGNESLPLSIHYKDGLLEKFRSK